MNRFFRSVILFTILLILRAAAAEPDSIRIRGNGTCGPYFISRYEIEPASLIIIKDSDTLDPAMHYTFNEQYNHVILESPISDSVFLGIRFIRHRPHLPKIFFRRDRNELPSPEAGAVDTLVPLARNNIGSVSAKDAFLQVGGVKSFGISSASGSGVSLDQSLQVQLEGQIGEGTHLKASLSDQNIPLQPEGTTRNLREIEQARIDVNSRRYSLTLGDFYESNNSRFIHFSKKVQGIRGGTDWRPWRAELTGASSRGSFRSYSFHGEEGRQGPYRLIGKNGETGILVLAGTEKVLLDGRRMVRGSGYDYVIDYSAGWITFTNRNMITAESEITVTYEYLEYDYERTLLHGSTSHETEKTTIRVSAVQEGDSKDHPLSYILTETDRSWIAAAGDTGVSVRTNRLPVITRTEAEVNGFYVSAADAGTTYYRFLPPDSVLYFSADSIYGPNFYQDPNGLYVAEVTDSLGGGVPVTVYRYQPDDSAGYQTRYSPNGVLPLPESRRAMNIQAGGKLGRFDIEGEGAVSDVDRNTFSALDDGDNTGFAGEATASYRVSETRGFFSSINAGGNDNNFRTFGTGAGYDSFRRRWNLSDSSYLGEIESRHAEATAGWKWENGSVVSGEGGVLENSRDITRRGAGEATVMIWKGGSARTRIDELFGDYSNRYVHLHRDGNEIRLPVRWGGPFFKVSHEWTAADSASIHYEKGFQDLTAGFEPGKIKLFEPRVEAGRQIYKISEEEGFLSGSDSIQIIHAGAGFSMTPWNGLAFRSAVKQRRLTYYRDPVPDAVYDLADVGTRYEPVSGALNFRNDYQLSSAEMQREYERYQYVGPGLGDYALDTLTGDYIPREGGGYDFYNRTADSSSTGREIRTGTHLTLRPVKWKKTGGFIDDVTLTSRLKLFSQKRQTTQGLRNRYLPSWGFSDADSSFVTRQEADFLQDVSFRPGGGPLDLRFRWNPSRQEDLRYGREVLTGRLYRLQGSRTFGKKVDAELTAEQEGRERMRYSFSGFTSLQYMIQNRRAESAVNYNFIQHYIAGLNTGIGNSTERESGADYDFYFAGPSLTRTFKEKGRIRADYRWVRVRGLGVLYYEMAMGYAKGVTHRWTLSGDYRLGDNLMLNLYYFGRMEEAVEKPFHQASMELRAYF